MEVTNSGLAKRMTFVVTFWHLLLTNTERGDTGSEVRASSSSSIAIQPTEDYYNDGIKVKKNRAKRGELLPC